MNRTGHVPHGVAKVVLRSVAIKPHIQVPDSVVEHVRHRHALLPVVVAVLLGTLGTRHRPVLHGNRRQQVIPSVFSVSTAHSAGAISDGVLGREIGTYPALFLVRLRECYLPIVQSPQDWYSRTTGRRLLVDWRSARLLFATRHCHTP